MKSEYKEITPYERFSNIAYYLIIAVISVLGTAFLPMIGSDIPGFKLPTGFASWTVWIVTKLAAAFVNVLIFFLFIQQAKVNTRNHENVLRANEILRKVVNKRKLKPESPGKHFAKTYTSKGVSLFATSILSVIAFGDAVINFDIMTFAAVFITMVFSVIFGFIQMKKEEDWWINKYLEYALYVEKTVQEEEQDKIKQESRNEKGVNECLISETKNLETSKNK